MSLISQINPWLLPFCETSSTETIDHGTSCVCDRWEGLEENYESHQSISSFYRGADEKDKKVNINEVRSYLT